MSPSLATPIPKPGGQDWLQKTEQQKQIITVREAARSQGFPDSYIFESINMTPSKVTGNSPAQYFCFPLLT
jgi:site-specific DNA-cytosine methylase